MTTSRLSIVALSVFTSLLAACAADSDADTDFDDTEVSEEDLTACKLGASCKKQKLLSTKEYAADKRAPARRRADIRVEVSDPSFEAVPRIFAQKTTGSFTFAGDHAILLSGSGEGASPFQIDDFLLVEVLGEDGSLLAAGHLGGQAPIQVGTVTSRQLATHESFSVPATDISSLLPRDRSFRLRLTALDFAARALVSDVYLLATAAPEPPPAPAKVNIFDDAAFSGAPLSKTEALALFAPGSTRANLGGFVMAQRTRECTQLTGCTAWTATTSMSLSGISTPGTGGWYDNPTSSDVPKGVVTGSTWLEIAGNDVALGLKSSLATMTAGNCALDGSHACNLKTKTQSCYWADRSYACYSYDSDVEAPSGAQIAMKFTVTGDYVRGRSETYATKADASSLYRETEYVIYAPTRGGAASLVTEGSEVFLTR